MAYERGRFGIEYRPEQPNGGNESPHILRSVVIVAAVALVSLSVTLWRRHRSSIAGEEVQPEAPVAERHPAPAATNAPPEVSEAKPVEPIRAKGERPREVRNLLLRLEAAEARRDVPLAISTIERLRALPGSPAADLDDALARRLGRLNRVRLFSMKNPWTEDVEVKRGNTASRIASEHGTTVACLKALNGGVDLQKIKVGDRIRVMDHPVFRLSVYRRTRIADLTLGGKFFCRYYLDGVVRTEVGVYVFPVQVRRFLHEKGIPLAPADVEELDLLLTKGAGMTVADFR